MSASAVFPVMQTAIFNKIGAVWCADFDNPQQQTLITHNDEKSYLFYHQ
ncbi:MAG: hypothetical protein LBF71_06085 [Campylobacteraceae bacterium]|nr:hypothetical protein [Campylobacteraceae bacterium]